MPFYGEHDDDLFDDDSPILKSDQARRIAAQNVASTVFNDIDQPKMFVQTIDPETGFPIAKTLVSGGIEYFNQDNVEIEEPVHYNIDSILMGDVSVREVMQESVSVTMEPNRPSPTIQPTRPSASPTVPQPDGIDESLARLGLDFLHNTPTPPPLLVHICCTGLVTFQVPFPCHQIVRTETLIVLVTDKRSTPSFREMDFQFDRNAVQVELACPDLERIPIVPPVPRTVSFEIGILRCTMFLRSPAEPHERKAG